MGEVLICREYTTTDTSVFNVNFKYKIVHFDGEVMTLKNVKAEMLQSSHIDRVRKAFIFASACTAHSMQGSSVDTDIAIWVHAR